MSEKANIAAFTGWIFLIKPQQIVTHTFFNNCHYITEAQKSQKLAPDPRSKLGIYTTPEIIVCNVCLIHGNISKTVEEELMNTSCNNNN